jgi:hypothetical protein
MTVQIIICFRPKISQRHLNNILIFILLHTLLLLLLTTTTTILHEIMLPALHSITPSAKSSTRKRTKFQFVFDPTPVAAARYVLPFQPCNILHREYVR